MVRYSAMGAGVIEKSAQNLINIGRKLAPYLRDQDQAQALLLIITKNKSKKGRLFSKNKDDGIVGSFNRHWQPEELTVLRMALLFITLYYAVLRYDMVKTPLQSSNVQKIWRVYTAMIVEQDLDIVFITQFNQRTSKAIKDKLRLCGEYTGDDALLIQIHDILVDKLHYKTSSNEPATGLIFLYRLFLLLNNIFL